MSYTNENIAKLAIKANKKLERLEKHGYKSPAYQSAQARLEMLGTRKNKDTGRRFKESFRNKREAQQYEAALKQFLGQKTSTLKGYRDYRNAVLEGAHERYNFEELGISDDEYMQIWEALPDSNNGRMFGSDDTVEIVSRALKVQGKWKEENRMSISEIVDTIQSSKTVKDAYRSLGFTTQDIKSINLGQL